MGEGCGGGRGKVMVMWWRLCGHEGRDYGDQCNEPGMDGQKKMFVEFLELALLGTTVIYRDCVIM